MRIVHVVRQFHPSVGGLEDVVSELATSQVAMGHAVRVVTLDRLFRSSDKGRLPAIDQVNGIDVVRIPYFGSTRYPIAWSVLKHIKDADIVHVHAIDFFFDYLAWTRLLHRKKLVVSTHGGFFHTPYAALLKRLWFATVTRLSLKWYSGVVAVSVSDYRRFESIRPRGMACIENGANLSKFAGASSPAFKKSIVSVGRFSQNKRLDLLISFVRELRQADPEWTLTIAGQPSDLGKDDLISLSESAGVSGAVTVVESPSNAAIRGIFTNSSFVASASDYEGFGVAAVEGMSAGLFPLLNDIPPFQRLIARSGSGMILDFSDVAASAQKLLARVPDIERDYLRCRARCADAMSAFDWHQVTQTYMALYEAATGTKVRTVLNVPIRVQTFAGAVAHLDRASEQKIQSVVAFANAHALNLANTNADFRSAMQKSIVLNDGIGVDIASWALYGARFPENLNGTDFVPNYLTKTRHRYRIFLLGAKPGVADRAARSLSRIAPQHEIVGCHHGYFDAGDAARITASIRSVDADVLLVAMGNPGQELWLHRHLAESGCTLGFGVGALFDFLAGEVPRASPSIRRANLEWVYRLMREPRRLARRYLLGNPAFLLRVIGQLLSGQRVAMSAPDLDEASRARP